MHSELDNVKDKIHTAEKSLETDTINLENKSVITSPISPPSSSHVNNNLSGRVQTKKEQRSGNTLYQELSFQVKEKILRLIIDTHKFVLVFRMLTLWPIWTMELILRVINLFNISNNNVNGYDVLLLFVGTGSWVHPGEYASSGKRNC